MALRMVSNCSETELPLFPRVRACSNSIYYDYVQAYRYVLISTVPWKVDNLVLQSDSFFHLHNFPATNQPVMATRQVTTSIMRAATAY